MIPTLEPANGVRLARARARAEVTAGRLELSDVLQAPYTRSAWVYDVVRWVPRIGPETARRRLARLEIGQSRPCGKLTARQRAAIVQEFGQ